MSWCPGGFSAVKEFLGKVTDTVLSAVTSALAFTATLINLEANPTVEMIEAAISQFTGLPIAADIATALSTIKGVEVTVQNLVTELQTWLSGTTTLQAHAQLIKLASTAAQVQSVAKGEPTHTENFYDTVTQIHTVPTE